jgi:hypothetical protein
MARYPDDGPSHLKFGVLTGISFPTGSGFERNTDLPPAATFVMNDGLVQKQEPLSHQNSPYQDAHSQMTQTIPYRAGMEVNTVDGIPAHMVHELEFNLAPQAVKGKGRGRGRGRKQTTEYIPPTPPVLGKGRAATQGVVVDIRHAGREQALAEQALKRKRFQDDELRDDSDERMLDQFTYKDEAQTVKKQKKREHHACDRCCRNKTKVSI